MRPFKWIVSLFLLLILFSARTTSAFDDTPTPQIVAIAGTFQSQLGCPGNWNTDCDTTYITYDPIDDLWRGTFELAAGEYEYKVALNGTWEENYGLHGESYGENIPLTVPEDGPVTFYYNHHTHFVTDNINHLVANVPGSYQDKIGCPGTWQPDCLRSWLQDPDGDGIYVYTTTYIPAGEYEAKVAVNESWDVNYGADGTPGGDNILFTVPENAQVTFTWDSTTHLLTIITEDAPEGSPTTPPAVEITAVFANPNFVTIPGTIQSQLGCPGDWQPDCANTFLTLDEEDNVWQAEFVLPAGEYEYKAAINQSWDENYGLNALRDGPNIPLSLAADQTVKFYYHHGTHWVIDNVNSPIITLNGSFQSEIGCANDNDPTCLRTWLQDPDGDGIASLIVAGVPGGEYSVQTAVNETTLTGEPQTFTANEGVELYFEYDREADVLTVSTEGAPSGDLSKFQAHWVSADTIAWDIDTEQATTYFLNHALHGGLNVAPRGLEDGEAIPLTVDPNGLSAEILAKFPHLAGMAALKIGPDDLDTIRLALKGQVAVSALNANGQLVDATSLQIPGVLDDLYTYDGRLGVTYDSDIPSLAVWAPTARMVRLLLFPSASPAAVSETLPMQYDSDTGVWGVTGTAEWTGQYYLYEVQVYVPSTGAVETNIVTDPYAISLAMNSTRSQIVNLADPALMPDGWQTTSKPPLAAPEDIVLYELHVRDFSWNDASVPQPLRGTYLAFTVSDSNGMTHLKSLADAGLTHVHLLPVFDIATIEENKNQWQLPDFAQLASLPPDSEEQQALIAPTQGLDGFNWGYDPFHYNVPEGSYASDPDGTARIVEFRQMVQALNEAGLRVVMDVVYNHTNASGQNDRSVLDKVVPGYYYRLDDVGRVATSTCCQNTATEHNMMRKLMVDSTILWATAYKVDGFRFDLMGHHMVGDMVAVQDALHSLTPEADGVNGNEIYIYGEGWNFGEVADNVRGTNATQFNMAGTGIGTFNDRVRDSVRGGSPFGDYLLQGFVTGLYTDPNAEEIRLEGTQKDALLLFADRIRVSLAGNLADYSFTGFNGNPVTGAEVDYNGSPTGYTQDPQEQIVYVSAHDNETLFDAIQYKAPESATAADRARMQVMGLSLVALAQGVPFFHAGDEMLRSKSFDRDSFDSGDWFNRLDFTYQDNGFGSGLPPAGKNRENWPLQQPLLANTAIKPTSADIVNTVAAFQELLQIRRSSPLFRLQTAESVMARVSFQNVGPEQIPGLIVMSLSDVGQESNLDANYDQIVVLFNATGSSVAFSDTVFTGMPLTLHPVQQGSADAVVKTAVFDPATATFTIPARTTAVFVAAEGSVTTISVVEPTQESIQPTQEAAPEATQEAPQPTQEAPQPTAEAVQDEPTSATGNRSLVFVGAGVLVVVLGLIVALARRRR